MFLIRLRRQTWWSMVFPYLSRSSLNARPKLSVVPANSLFLKLLLLPGCWSSRLAYYSAVRRSCQIVVFAKPTRLRFKQVMTGSMSLIERRTTPPPIISYSPSICRCSEISNQIRAYLTDVAGSWTGGGETEFWDKRRGDEGREATCWTGYANRTIRRRLFRLLARFGLLSTDHREVSSCLEAEGCAHGDAWKDETWWPDRYSTSVGTKLREFCGR